MGQALDELKQWPNWIGHLDKRPMNPHTGYGASINNPDHWSSFAEAWQATKRYGWSGLGFVFTESCGIVGIDLDQCLYQDGPASEPPVPQAWARDVILCLNSYTEISPSGRGLHILCKGTIPGNLAQTPFEMYARGRYFTITGREFPLGSDRLRMATVELAALYAVFAPGALTRRARSATCRAAYTVQRQYGQNDEEGVRAALAHIPVYQTYENWLRVLLAVHAIFPDEKGIALIEEWSPGYPGEVARKFRSFSGEVDGPRITAATLFYLARQHGYRPPPPPATLRSRPLLPYQAPGWSTLWASLPAV